MAGPSAALHNLGRMPSAAEANLITRCKNCPASVFRHQPKAWQNKPRPGWVHVDCDDPERREPMTSERVPGHTLRNEGNAYDAGWRASRGVGRCSCGASSPVLDSNAARKRWHRQHKDDVRGRA